jgi:hypothetical protein
MEPTEKEKVVFLNEHFAYEVEELVFCDSFIASLFHHRAAIDRKGLFAGLQNTGMEHFLLHARVLLEFLFFGPHEDEPRASDYVKNWSDIRQWTETLKTFQDRVNKEITHLSWRRVGISPEDKTWMLQPIVDDLLNTTGLFLTSVDNSYLEERARNLWGLLALRKTAGIDVFGMLMGMD